MLKHIAVTELCLGMYIHKFCGSWVDHSLWKPSFLLKNESELQRTQPGEVPEESDTATQATSQATEGLTPPRVSLQEEISQALKVCSRSKAAVVEKVKVFFSARSRMPIEQTIVDMAKREGLDRIVSRERVDDWGFKGIDELWSGLEASKTSHFDPE